MKSITQRIQQFISQLCGVSLSCLHSLGTTTLRQDRTIRIYLNITGALRG